jgi:hypothetical protein
MTLPHAITGASPDVRDAALALLDEISAPLTQRQIQKALEKAGHSRLRSRRMAKALEPLHLIALLPR